MIFSHKYTVEDTLHNSIELRVNFSLKLKLTLTFLTLCIRAFNGLSRVRAEMSSGRVGPGLSVSPSRPVVVLCQVSNRREINFLNIIIGVSLQTTDWRSVSVGLSV